MNSQPITRYSRRRKPSHPAIRSMEQATAAAHDEAMRLRRVMFSVQRAAFSAGYEAAAKGEPQIPAYAEWCNGHDYASVEP